MANLSKIEAILSIEKLIEELQEILSEENLKSYCIYSKEAARIIQIQGIVSFLKEKFKITEEDLK